MSDSIKSVLVQHLQRYAGTRQLRAQRTHRRQGVILNDGSRIRQRGYRFTELPLDKLAENHQMILERVRTGILAVYTLDEQELNYDALVALLKGEKVEVSEKSHREAVQAAVTPVRDEEVAAPASVVEAPTEVPPPAPEEAAPEAEAVEEASAESQEEKKSERKKSNKKSK